MEKFFINFPRNQEKIFLLDCETSTIFHFVPKRPKVLHCLCTPLIHRRAKKNVNKFRKDDASEKNYKTICFSFPFIGFVTEFLKQFFNYILRIDFMGAKKKNLENSFYFRPISHIAISIRRNKLIFGMPRIFLFAFICFFHDLPINDFWEKYFR